MADSIEDLERLIEKTDEFIQEVFDHSCSHFRGKLYDFKSATEAKLKRAKDAEKAEAAIQNPHEA